MKIFKILFFLLTFNFTYCQSNERMEDSVHIFWQPNLKLNLSDFKLDGTTVEFAERDCEKAKLCACIVTNFNVIIDIPKTKKDRKKLFEKIYFVPVLEKTKSYNLTKDTMLILHQKVEFDMEEWATRYARQQLKKTTSSFKKKYGSIITWHNVIIKEAIEKRNKLIKEFTYDVYLEPKINAYENWRLKINEMLEELKDYATKPEDCLRFIQQKPFEENYEEYEYLGENK